MTFDAAAVAGLFDRVQSHALETGLFESVNNHEPKSKPPPGLTAAVWVQTIRPIPSSGLASTSGLVSFKLRIYSSFLAKPEDAIDPNILTAVATLMAMFSGDLDLGGVADTRNVDLLGQTGESLAAQAGYVDISKAMFRIMDLTVPIIVNDMWVQDVTG